MATRAAPADRRDFFISYTSADEQWATWIAWHLEAGGYTTILQAWDFSAGQNFIQRMHEALSCSDRVLAVVSAAYLDSRYCTDEWTAALVNDDRGKDRLLPVLIEQVPRTGLLAPIFAVNLAKTASPEAARAALLDGVRGARRPDRPPPFPGGQPTPAVPDTPPPQFPGMHGGAAEPATPHSPPVAELGWSGGLEVAFGADAYVIHDPVQERAAPNRSVVHEAAKAQQLRPAQRAVLLKRIRHLRDLPPAPEWRQALFGEQRLLTELDGVEGVPRLIAIYPGSDQVVLAQTYSPGRPLRQVYGPSDQPLDTFRVVTMLRSLRSLCATLNELHTRGRAHRALTPDGVFMLGDGRRSRLRDLGLATTSVQPGEGPTLYRAPEQERPLRDGSAPGSHTDVYQLAGIVYHVVTGHAPPQGIGRPPVRAFNAELPSGLDAALDRALEPSVRKRERSIWSFWHGLDNVFKRPHAGGERP